jgi:NADH-quinone oxidoreductase subunit N
MTFGNLAAYGQTNLKRLLAYSTIAHAGFMIAGFATLNQAGVEAVLFYLAAYLLMNLGAFAVIAFLRNATGSEDLADFRGLVYRAPALVITLGVFLLSLIGLPPLAGFVAKFQIFQALFVGAVAAGPEKPVIMYSLYLLVVVGGLNTVLSLFYYVKVLKVMILEQPVEAVEGTAPAPVRVGAVQAGYAIVLAALVLIAGLFWDPIAKTSVEGSRTFAQTEGKR